MNDPFFSATSRNKLSLSNSSVASKGPNGRFSQTKKKNNFKSLKSVKTNSIIQNVKARSNQSLITIKKLIEEDISSTSSSSSEDDEIRLDIDKDTNTSKRFKDAKNYLKTDSSSLNSDDEEVSDVSSDSQSSSGDEVDAAKIDRELISKRIIKDATFKEGKRFSPIGGFISSEVKVFSFFNGKKLPGGRSLLKGSPSAICVHPQTRSIFCVTKKSLGVFRWILSSDFSSIASTQAYFLNATKTYPCFQSLAVSSDGVFLVAGGIDMLIHVWDVSSGNYLRALRHHRGPITGLVFRKMPTEAPVPQNLYSSSTDRSIKIWQFSPKRNIGENESKVITEEKEDAVSLAYVDTLFGHQESILDLSVLSKERFTSVGGRDRSLRFWKVSDSTHLVFNVPLEHGSLNYVCMLTESAFITGSENGDLTLWNSAKKRPCYSVTLDSAVSSLAALGHSTIFATGGSSGTIKIWKVADSFDSFEEISSFQIHPTGFVSSISWIYPSFIFSISSRKEFLNVLCQCAIAASLSRENRLGRWKVATALPASIQGVYLVGLSTKSLADINLNPTTVATNDSALSIESKSESDEKESPSENLDSDSEVFSASISPSDQEIDELIFKQDIAQTKLESDDPSLAVHTEGSFADDN